MECNDLRSTLRNFDVRVTTSRRGVDRGNHTPDMQAQYRPLGMAQHDQRDGANRQRDPLKF